MASTHTKQCEKTKLHRIETRVRSLSVRNYNNVWRDKPQTHGPESELRHVGRAQAFMQLRPRGAFSTQYGTDPT